MCGLSLTLDKISKDSIKAKEVTLLLPIGKMTIPESIQQLDFSNKAIAIYYDLKIIKNFMNIINNTDFNEIIAVHCRAGLGRTGLLICIWLIIKLNFEPREAIAYLRIMRPGSIMGNQGFFIENIGFS